MPIFQYEAINDTGKTRRGNVDADTPRDARDKLRRQKLRVTTMRRIDAGGNTGRGILRFRLQRKVNIRDLAILTRQFSTLLASGVHLSEALNVLVNQIADRRLELVFRDLREKIVSGSGLADALSLHPSHFSDLYVNMVRAGEASGNLDEILARLADYLQKQASLRGKLAAALTYPAVMVVVGVFVVIFLMSFVVPKITTILEKKGNVLPMPTQVLMTISDLFKGYWLPGMLGVLGVMILVRMVLATDKGRFWFDSFILRVPVIGTLIQKQAISRFAVTFSTLLKSGLPALESLNIVRKIVNNALLSKTLGEVADRILEGADISTPIKNSRMFPPMVGYMIAVGEQSGELEDILDRISETYEEELDLAMQRLTALIEPVIIILLAVVVGFIIMAVLLPLLQFSEL
ncbi:MAG TPA: type II secretion system protein GspF [Planctomycetes bacterium]|nr:type II secretion system protein GspF [Planctomycetota bacterium]